MMGFPWLIFFWLMERSHAEPKIPSVLWRHSPPSLTVSISPFVSVKQRELLESGFNTFSEVKVSTADPMKQQIHVPCTVKYDLWSESYEILTTHKLSAKTFDHFAQTCLEFRLTDPGDLELIAEKGIELGVELSLLQVSPEQSQEIRNWLVKQQTGVVQSFFAQMLGDFDLNETVRIKMVVPPIRKVER